MNKNAYSTIDLSARYSARMGVFMFNMHNKKTKQRISAVIIILVVAAMVLPTLAYFFT